MPIARSGLTIKADLFFESGYRCRDLGKYPVGTHKPVYGGAYYEAQSAGRSRFGDPHVDHERQHGQLKAETLAKRASNR